MLWYIKYNGVMSIDNGVMYYSNLIFYGNINGYR